FGARHTLARYETAFYTPMLSDCRSYQSWRDAGSPDTAVRAAGLVKRLLADYQPPPLDAARCDALTAFFARRRAEGGAPPADWCGVDMPTCTPSKDGVILSAST